MSLSRRAFTSGLAFVPLAAAQSPVMPHAAGNDTAGEFDASEWRPKVFDEHQLESVGALAEVIIPRTDTPGARDALVHVQLDHILSESPGAERTKFLEGLWWLDGYCLRTESKPFQELDAPAQLALVRQLSDSSEPGLQPGTKFVELAKTWTAKIYYSTQVGQEELNKGGRLPARYTSACSS